MKNIVIFLIYALIAGSGVGSVAQHKTFIDRGQALRNTLSFMYRKTEQAPKRFSPVQPAQPNAQKRKLTASFDKEARANRSVHMQMVQSRLLKDISSVTIGRLRRQMTNMSKNLQRCLDEEFAKDPEEIASFDEILNYCVGFTYSIIERFYEDIEFKTYELMKDKIFRSLPARTCDGRKEFQCRSFFRILQLFIKMEYDVMQSLEFSMKELKRQINAEDLLTLFEFSNQCILNYKDARDGMKQEKDFLANYFRDKFEEYMTEFPDAHEIQKESLKEKAAEAEYLQMKARNEKPEHDYLNPNEVQAIAAVEAINNATPPQADEEITESENDESVLNDENEAVQDYAQDYNNIDAEAYQPL
jgi:hypothetical protein